MSRSVGPQLSRLRSLGLVFLGGTLGTAARQSISLLVPGAAHGVPWAILAVNLLGAFLLGVLLDSLVRRGPDSSRRQGLRLLLGTGFLGGFTTYSALATDTVLLLTDQVLWALVYSLGTVVAGGVMTGAGIMTATQLHRTSRG